MTREFRDAGTRRVTLTVTDTAGNSSTVARQLTVRRYRSCTGAQVDRDGDWRSVRDDRARNGRYCDTRGQGAGADVLTTSFGGPTLVVRHATARDGGQARVVIDGEVQEPLLFDGRSTRPDFGHLQSYRRLGRGPHTVRIVQEGGTGYLEGFVLFS